MKTTGQYVTTSTTGESVRAFVPNPLPPDPPIKLTDEDHDLMEKANRALGRLDGITTLLPDVSLFLYFYIRKEAVLSSQIEGTQSSFSDLLLHEEDLAPGVPLDDVQEVSNYVAAMNHGLKRLREDHFPLSLRLIREMHGLLMEGVRGEDKQPGEFRASQNWIGLDGMPIDTARFIPPPPGPELNRALDALEKYLHVPSDLPPVVRLALVHYQFESIHPFVDGNGRIGRLLISLMLCLEDVLPMPLLYLSAYFEKTRAEYYDRLLRVNHRGMWNDWLVYFARGVASESLDAVDRAQRLKNLQAKYIQKVRTARTSALLTKLIEELFNQPMVTMGKVAELLGVTPNTAQKHIDRLIDNGILRELTGRKRNRIFVAEGIIKSIYEPYYRRSGLKVGKE